MCVCVCVCERGRGVDGREGVTVWPSGSSVPDCTGMTSSTHATAGVNAGICLGICLASTHPEVVRWDPVLWIGVHIQIICMVPLNLFILTFIN